MNSKSFYKGVVTGMILTVVLTFTWVKLFPNQAMALGMELIF